MSGFIDPKNWPDISTFQAEVAQTTRSRGLEDVFQRSSYEQGNGDYSFKDSDFGKPVEFSSDEGTNLVFVDASAAPSEAPSVSSTFARSCRQIHKGRLERYHMKDEEYRVPAKKNRNALYSSTTHFSPTISGKNSAWNKHNDEHAGLSYYERLHKRIARKEINGFEGASREYEAIKNDYGDVLEQAPQNVVAKAKHQSSANASGTSYASTYKDRTFDELGGGHSNLYHEKKPFTNYISNVVNRPKQATSHHESDFATRNRDQGYDVIANGGAPITEGSKLLHRVRRKDAEKRDDKRYWLLHGSDTHTGKNDAWNTTKPKFSRVAYDRKARNPAPPRLRRKINLANQRERMIAAAQQTNFF